MVCLMLNKNDDPMEFKRAVMQCLLALLRHTLVGYLKKGHPLKIKQYFALNPISPSPSAVGSSRLMARVSESSGAVGCWMIGELANNEVVNYNRNFEFQIGTEWTQRPIDLQVIIKVNDAVPADVCRWYFRDPNLNGSQTFYPKRAFFEGTLDHNHFVVYSIRSIDLREICGSL